MGAEMTTIGGTNDDQSLGFAAFRAWTFLAVCPK